MTNQFTRLACASLMLLASVVCTAAQTGARRPAQPRPSPRDSTPAPATTADEDFEINITERRITEESFAASTAVEVDEGEGGLNLRVGVAVGAESIDVILRNVRGRVRFRASLAAVLQRLNLRRDAAPVAPP